MGRALFGVVLDTGPNKCQALAKMLPKAELRQRLRCDEFGVTWCLHPPLYKCRHRALMQWVKLQFLVINIIRQSVLGLSSYTCTEKLL